MRAGTSIHISALDGIVNVNSLFTLAVFLGLTWNPRDPTNTLVTNPNCFPSASHSEAIITFHVYSFSCFLFSSLIAFGLKQAIRNPSNPDLLRVEFLVRINKTLLRVGMLVSGVGSVMGCGFLMMALVNVVQVKVGLLGCWGSSGYALAAVLPLVTFVPIGMLVYVGVVVYAFLS